MACENGDGTYDLVFDEGEPSEVDDVMWSDLRYEGELKREVTAPIKARARQQKQMRADTALCTCMLSSWLGRQLKGENASLNELGEMLLRPERAPLKLLRRWIQHLSVAGAAGGFCIG